MTSEGPRKVESIILEVFMLSELDAHKTKALQSTAEECPIKLNLEESIAIDLNWNL